MAETGAPYQNITTEGRVAAGRPCVMQIDLMLKSTSLAVTTTPATSDVTPAHAISTTEPPTALQAIPQSEWIAFAEYVAKYSDKFLHHTDTMRFKMDLVVSILLIVGMVVVVYFNAHFYLLFGMAIFLFHTHSIAQHDKKLQKKIVQRIDSQPFAKYGYEMEYISQTFYCPPLFVCCLKPRKRAQKKRETMRLIQFWGKGVNY